LDILLAGDEVGCESGWDDEASLPCDDFVSAKLGGTANYNLNHVN